MSEFNRVKAVLIDSMDVFLNDLLHPLQKSRVLQQSRVLLVDVKGKGGETNTCLRLD